jgi:ATP adenylyltransferase
MNTKFVDIDNARVEEQKKVMRQIIADGLCPFCQENFVKYHKLPILKQGKYWLLTQNQWPYEDTKVHLLAILLEHAEHLSEVPAEAGQELLEMMQWAEKEYAVPGGGFSMRFGDTNYSAGTVAHLHVQFIMPDWGKPDFKPVRIKLGKSD